MDSLNYIYQLVTNIMMDICTYRASIGIFNLTNCKSAKMKRNKLSSNPRSTWKAKTTCLNVVLTIWILSCLTAELSRESPGPGANSPASNNPVRTCPLIKPGADYCTFLLHTNWFLTARKRNKLVKIVNGNRSNKSSVYNIGHWNAGAAHYQNKHSDIEACLLANSLDILGVSEANCNSNVPSYEVQVEGYSVVWPKMAESSSNNIARLLLLVKDGTSFKVREDLMSPDAANIWIELSTNGGRKILVGQIYREFQILGQSGHDSASEASQLERWRTIVGNWAKAGRERDTLVLGDLNIDYLKWGSETGHKGRLITEANTQLVTEGFTQLNEKPSWFQRNCRPACLDHIWTNNVGRIVQSVNVPNARSDHNVVIAKIRGKGKTTTFQSVRKRDWRNFEQKTYTDKVRKINWGKMKLMEDPDLMAEYFVTQINRVLDVLAPMKTWQPKRRDKNWLKEETLGILADRDVARKTAMESKSDEDWARYKRLRNLATNAIRKDKNEDRWRKTNSWNIECSTAKMWKEVRKAAGWDVAAAPTDIQDGPSILRSPREIAEKFALYFREKIRLINDGLSNPQIDPLELLRRGNARWNPRPESALELTEVTPEKVGKLIDKLSGSKATGYDGLEAAVIKIAKGHLTQPICWIVNASIRTGKFPRIWKIAKIVPIYKNKGSKLEPKSYRPVSILSPVSKVLECCILEQLESHMTKYHLWHRLQNAYRQGRNTTTALLQLSDGWLDAIERKQRTALMLIDLSAAFDTIDKNLLIEKLALYNCGESVTRWIENYMSARLQYVTVGSKASSLKPLDSGVPQGSCLGPALFIIFTNDMLDIDVKQTRCSCSQSKARGMWTVRCSGCAPAVAYADDTTIVMTADKGEDLKLALDEALKAYEKYLTANRLSINVGKTEILRIGYRLGKAADDNLELEAVDSNGNHIRPPEDCRLLGVRLNRDLKWVSHVQSDEAAILKRITKRLSALKFIGKYIETNRKVVLVNGLINSLIVYAIQLWGIGATKSQLRMTQTAQNQAGKWALGVGRFTSTRKVLARLNWLSVRQLTIFHSLTLLWKQCRGETDFMNEAPDWESSRTKGEDRLKLKPYKMEFRRNSWKFRAVSWWNLMPETLRIEKSLPRFRSGLKIWVMNYFAIK